MKPLSYTRQCLHHLVCGVAILALTQFIASADPVSLKGSNGRVVEFHAIKTANEAGLTTQMVADGPLLEIAWDRLDLEALKTEHPKIYTAYLAAKQGETVDLEKESAPENTPASSAAKPAVAAPAKYEGWADTKVGNIEFMLQLPAGEPRGILLVSMNNVGNAFESVRYQERGSGAWGDFQNKHSFAILSYTATKTKKDSENQVGVMPFVYAEKESGKALFSALAAFAKKLDQPTLAELPIAIYGEGKTGASFAYHLVLAFPDRILAAVLSKGAFYDAAPTEASVAVPIAFVWGQYSNKPELWRSEHDQNSALSRAAPLKSLWTNAREFRGNDSPNPEVEYFGRQYLLEMIPLRMPVEAVAKESSSETGDGESAAEEAKAKLTPKAIDRSMGFVGQIDTGDFSKIGSADQEMGEDETYLPNQTVATLWKKFMTGELEAPIRSK